MLEMKLALEMKKAGRGCNPQHLRETLEALKENLTQAIAPCVKMTFLLCQAVWRDWSLLGNI